VACHIDELLDSVARMVYTHIWILLSDHATSTIFKALNIGARRFRVLLNFAAALF
jgi:hypothetical protein